MGTTAQGAGDVLLRAGNDMTLAAAQVSAGNALAVQAGRDITSTTVLDSASRDMSQTGRKSSLAVSASQETVRGSTFSAGSAGTTLSGGSVQIGAGRDITTRGAQVVATGDVLLAARRNLDIGTAENTHTRRMTRRGYYRAVACSSSSFPCWHSLIGPEDHLHHACAVVPRAGDMVSDSGHLWKIACCFPCLRETRLERSWPWTGYTTIRRLNKSLSLGILEQSVKFNWLHGYFVSSEELGAGRGC